jgi:hypothetical protein
MKSEIKERLTHPPVMGAIRPNAETGMIEMRIEDGWEPICTVKEFVDYSKHLYGDSK